MNIPSASCYEELKDIIVDYRNLCSDKERDVSLDAIRRIINLAAITNSDKYALLKNINEAEATERKIAITEVAKSLGLKVAIMDGDEPVLLDTDVYIEMKASAKAFISQVPPKPVVKSDGRDAMEIVVAVLIGVGVLFFAAF